MPDHLLFFVAGLYADVAIPPTTFKIPLQYETPKQQSLNTTQQYKVFTARLDCANLRNAEINFCAELPGNWEWNPFKGIVKMAVFNQQNTDNVSNSISRLHHFCMLDIKLTQMAHPNYLPPSQGFKAPFCTLRGFAST